MSHDAAPDPAYLPTEPTPHHEFLKRFLGEWRGETEMIMGPDGPPAAGSVHETVESLGGLFAHARGVTAMPDGTEMRYYSAFGYDLTFEEYRGVFYCDASSHIWTTRCEIGPDGDTFIATCEGPNMDPAVDSLTAAYRDVYRFEGDDVRTTTSSGLQPDGSWFEFQKTTLRRV